MSDAMTRDRELTLKISGQIELMRRYKESHNVENLLALVERMLGPHHLLVVILGRRRRTRRSVFIIIGTIFKFPEHFIQVVHEQEFVPVELKVTITWCRRGACVLDN